MDYKRIYAEFIKDRREKEKGLSGYVERHHILPRAMGGDNSRENLIRLTPEDHYFAHLLLAFIHRGGMVSALWRMLQAPKRNYGRRLAARRSYGMAKRLVAKHLAEQWSGNNNPLFNDTKHEWWNYRSNDTCSATLYDMHLKFGGSRAQWTNVLKGNHPSVFGWMPSSRKATHVRSEKGQVFNFVNRDGRTFVGTQGQFADTFGINLASCSRVVRRRSVTECGWRLEGVDDRRTNAPKDGRRSSCVGRGRKYCLRHRDGRHFHGTAEDFRIIECRPAGFQMAARLSGLQRGKMPSLYGWYLDQAEVEQKET